VPAPVRTLLRRCLRKEASQRLHDIADAKLEIVEIQDTKDAVASPGPIASERGGAARWRDRAFGVAFASAVLAGGGALWWALSPGAAPPVAPSRLELGIRFPDNYLPGAGLAISPDGRFLAVGVFATKFEIQLHSFDSDETRAVSGTDGGSAPFWSPNGASLGFFVPGKLLQVDPVKGKPTEICSLPLEPGGGATWSSRGTVLFAVGGGLFQVPAEGGTPVRLVLDGNWVSIVSPRFLADQRHFIFFVARGNRGEVRLGSLDSHETTVLVESDAPAAFAQPDRLLFLRGAAMLAQTLNQQTLRLEGQPVQVADHVPSIPGFANAQFAASADKLAFVAATAGSVGRLTWFDRAGVPGPSIPQAGDAEFLNPAVAPDGRRVAVNRLDPSTGNWDVWVLNDDGGQVKVTSDPARDTDPVWSPKGDEIAFVSNRTGHLALYRKAVDRSGPETPLKDFDSASTRAVVPSDWSTNGYILYTIFSSGAPISVWALPLSGGPPFRLTDGRDSVYDARVSPDGKWVAYSSFETGTPEVYVEHFPVPGRKMAVSQGGAVHPRWTAGGAELVYWVLPSSLMARPFVKSGDDAHLGPPRTLRPTVLSLPDYRTHYDVTDDGRLLVRQPAGPQGPGIKVVANWADRLH
jgi:Tol biopolymer transport system component